MKRETVILALLFFFLVFFLTLLSRFMKQKYEIIGGMDCTRIDYGTSYSTYWSCTGADVCGVATYIDYCSPYAQSAGVRLEGPLKDINLNYLGTQTRCCDGSKGCRIPQTDWFYIYSGESVTTSNDCYLSGCYYCGSACRNSSTVTAIQWIRWDCSCTEKWLDEYQCNPYYLDIQQRKYLKSDCTKEWRDYKNCNDYNYYTSWSWTCYDENTRKGTRTYYDYTCSNGNCVVGSATTETTYEACPSGYKCSNGNCVAVTPTGEINLVFIGVLSILSLAGIGIIINLLK